MKCFLIICAILMLAAVSLQAAEAGGALKVGAFMEKGQTSAFAVTVGTNLVVASDSAKSARLTNFTGLFHANNSDEIEGATNLSYLEKSLNLSQYVDLDLRIGSGFLYDIKDAENELSAAVALEAGASLYKWVSLGISGIYVPKQGPDQFFLGLTIDLLNPL